MLLSFNFSSPLGLWATGLMCYFSLVAIHEGYLRQSYREQVQDLPQQAEQRLQENGDTLAAVKWVIAERNSLKQQTRQRGNVLPDYLAAHRNIQKYGQAIGPTYTALYQLTQKKHTEWNRSQIHQEIITKAGQSNPNVDKNLKEIQWNGILMLSLLTFGFLLGLYTTEKGKRLKWTSFYLAHFVGAALGGTICNTIMMTIETVPFGLPIPLLSWKIGGVLLGVFLGSLLGRSIVKPLPT